jgi:hypothetical protein
MAAWSVLVWNMALGYHADRAKRNWAGLGELMDQRHVDITLLSEVSTWLLAERRAATAPSDPDPVVFSEAGTIGRDRNKNGEPKDRSGWTAAVFSPKGATPIADARAVATVGRRSPIMDFGPSRAGSWVAASVPYSKLAGGRSTKHVTCVSLYGLIEEITDASMHTSLSEISPLLSDPRHKELVLVGGDFNISTAWSDHESRMRCAGVLERLESYGLVDCLRLVRKPGRLKGCTCVFGSRCEHTWTRRDPGRPRIPYQMDYLFASQALARRLVSCEALDPEDWRSFSDHAPIVATFD